MDPAAMCRSGAVHPLSDSLTAIKITGGSLMHYCSKTSVLAFLHVVLAVGFVLTFKTATPQTDTVPSETPRPCIVVSEIEDSSVLTNTVVALKMRDGRRLRMHLENSCPQLKFHGHFAFRAQKGQLCVGRDILIARSGEPCRIIDIETTAEAG